MDVKGQVDIGSDSFRVINSQNSLQDESGFVLVVQSIARVVQHVLDTGYVSGDERKGSEQAFQISPITCKSVSLACSSLQCPSAWGHKLAQTSEDN